MLGCGGACGGSVTNGTCAGDLQTGGAACVWNGLGAWYVLGWGVRCGVRAAGVGCSGNRGEKPAHDRLAWGACWDSAAPASVMAVGCGR